jgi:hypothetical protein
MEYCPLGRGGIEGGDRPLVLLVCNKLATALVVD